MCVLVYSCVHELICLFVNAFCIFVCLSSIYLRVYICQYVFVCKTADIYC